MIRVEYLDEAVKRRLHTDASTWMVVVNSTLNILHKLNFSCIKLLWR